MSETRRVLSRHLKVKHSIAGHNMHLLASQTLKTKWFVYLEKYKNREGTYQYVGSTDSMTHRRANTKSKCKSIANNQNTKPGTGLERPKKRLLSIWAGAEKCKHQPPRAVYYLRRKTTSSQPWGRSRLTMHPVHSPKKIEDKWTCKLGTYHGKFGLNERDEISNRVRARLLS